jgi:hypothetical protein
MVRLIPQRAERILETELETIIREQAEVVLVDTCSL